MPDNPLSTNPSIVILAAGAGARYVPWLAEVDRRIGCLARVALQRDYSFLAAFHGGLSVSEAICDAIPWLRGAAKIDGARSPACGRCPHARSSKLAPSQSASEFRRDTPSAADKHPISGLCPRGP
jgi:hypothetical protein